MPKLAKYFGMLRIITIILLLFFVNTLVAQKKQIVRAIIYKGDTIPHIHLDEVVVIGKKRSSNWYKRQYRRYTRLEYNVRRAYPYARIAASKIREIEQKLSKVSNESERKEIIKKEYALLMKTFKAPLMKLSITQGRILIRLIYRETSHTSFTHIQEYKGSVNAYFWQSISLLFGNNLKAAYDPYGEDAEIEDIVLKIIK